MRSLTKLCEDTKRFLSAPSCVETFSPKPLQKLETKTDYVCVSFLAYYVLSLCAILCVIFILLSLVALYTYVYHLASSLLLLWMCTCIILLCSVTQCVCVYHLVVSCQSVHIRVVSCSLLSLCIYACADLVYPVLSSMCIWRNCVSFCSVCEQISSLVPCSSTFARVPIVCTNAHTHASTHAQGAHQQ